MSGFVGNYKFGNKFRIPLKMVHEKKNDEATLNNIIKHNCNEARALFILCAVRYVFKDRDVFITPTGCALCFSVIYGR